MSTLWRADKVRDNTMQADEHTCQDHNMSIAENVGMKSNVVRPSQRRAHVGYAHFVYCKGNPVFSLHSFTLPWLRM